MGSPQIVCIVASEESLEANLCRMVIESLGHQTLIFRPGQPRDFLAALGASQHYGSVLVLSGHGSDGGFVFPDYAASVDTSMLANGVLHHDGLASVSVGPVDVISTCCTTGHEKMAEAFLRAGAKSFTGPKNWPDGHLMPLFLHLFFRSLLLDDLMVGEATDLANQCFADPGDKLTTIVRTT
jgi:hypothetical protein